jgi:hypothetical protein
LRPREENAEQLEYLACIGVSVELPPPRGMAVFQLPAGRYAKFTHRGKVERVDSTVNYIYSSWLARSGLRHTYAADIEFYGDEYHPESDESVIHYAIPVAPAGDDGAPRLTPRPSPGRATTQGSRPACPRVENHFVRAFCSSAFSLLLGPLPLLSPHTDQHQRHLDGCVDHQEASPTMRPAFFTRLMEGAARCWGRVTYEMMETAAAGRPRQEAPPAIREWAVAGRCRSTSCRRREQLPWTNSHHIAGDLRAGVQARTRPRRRAPGSGKLATGLDRLDLSTVLFLVNPITGHGPTLYQGGLLSTRQLNWSQRSRSAATQCDALRRARPSRKAWAAALGLSATRHSEVNEPRWWPRWGVGQRGWLCRF